jgi:hypothetical protein
MATSTTPDLEAARKKAFDNRRFDPESYAKEIDPELPPIVQVAIAGGELAEIENPTEPTSEAQEELARQKAESDRLAAEFCFLDPKDYEDEEARRGRVLKPGELLDLVIKATGKQCWFSMASEAMMRKELSPRDVALAKLKIGENPENLRNPERWLAAIEEVRQEERNLVPLHSYKLFALQICRQEGKPEYCCWLPACWLREYDLVRFDSHGVPEQQVRGWRTVLIEVIRKQFATEEAVTRVFGEATGPASRRYNMVLQGLRNRREEDTAASYEPRAASDPAADAALAEAQSSEPEADTSCQECHRRVGHFVFCSKFNSWLNEPVIEEPNGRKTAD